jgi:hypothetical protein
MAEPAAMVYSYAKDLLRKLSGAEPTVDPDGDLRFVLEGGTYFLRVMGSRNPVVRVFAIAAETERSQQVLELVNEMNSHLVFARAFWVDGQILIESDHGGLSLDEADLVNLCGSVARATDEVAPILRERFGQLPLFEEHKQDDYRQPGRDMPGYL